MGIRGVVLVLFVIALIPSVSAVFDCSVRQNDSCFSNETVLIHLNSSLASNWYNNSHAQLANFTGTKYNWTICCWTDAFRNMNNSCIGSYTRVLGLQETNNSHVQIGTNSSYTWSACLNLTGTLECEYPNSACSAGNAEIISMASSEFSENTSNAHMGDFDLYQRKVCCGLSNTAPVIDALVVNSTFGFNRTSENLTAYVTATDDDGDNVSLNFDWRVNGTSIAVVNMNFDVNNSAGTNKTRDYSTFQNNGTEQGSIVWNSTSGWNNTGAYNFDGVDDYINITDDASLNFGNFTNFTASTWVKMFNDGGNQIIFMEGADEGSSADGGWVVVYHNSMGVIRGQITSDHWNYYCIINGTTDVADGNWHLVTVVFNRAASCTVNDIQIYVDGVLESDAVVGSGANTNANVSNNDPLHIGRYNNAAGAAHLNGSMDDARIYNRSLSPEQILALYNNRTHIIVSNETTVGNNWTACVTPNDADSDGTTVCSEGLLIGPKGPPDNVTLIYPVDGNTTAFERFMAFDWTDGYDYDGDTITYTLNLTVESGACSVQTEQSSISPSTYTFGELCVDQRYWWNVSACDEDGCSGVNQTFNFTVASVVSLNLSENFTNLGVFAREETKATDADGIAPFIVENIGNVQINISINGTNEPFSSDAMPTTNYQFMAGVNETDAFNTTGSQITYTPFDDVYQHLLKQLEYNLTKNAARIDVNITAPTNEPPGDKQGNMTVQAVAS